MWQVSGRSDITDFEEVVKLDISIIKKVNFAHHFDTKKLISKLENGLRKYDARKERYVGNFLGRYKERESDYSHHLKS